MDKAGDSEKVAGLIERLREAITNYQASDKLFAVSSATHTGGQVSQQQAIYDRITNLTVRICRVSFTATLIILSFVKSSFDALLKLHEVMQHSEFATAPAETWTEFPAGEEQVRLYYGTTGWAVLRGQWRCILG